MEREDFELNRCLEAITKSKAKTVGLQYPAGLKKKATELAGLIEKGAHVQVILSADHSFGACDIRQMPVDMIIHLGHAPIPDLHYKNVFFYESPLLPPENFDFLEKALPLLGKRVGLLTTVQFRAWLPKIKDYLENKNHQIFIGKFGGRVAYEGQLLGCDYSAARAVEKKVDSYLFIGSGEFHPLAVAMITQKPVIIADFERCEARCLDEEKDRMIRRRHAAIASTQDAKTFGIIVSTKLGQNRMKLARNLKHLAEKHGRIAYIFLIDTVNQDALEGYRVDAWVNTACPRVAIEDYALFKKPMLTPQEFRIALGEIGWEKYEFDEIRC